MGTFARSEKSGKNDAEEVDAAFRGGQGGPERLPFVTALVFFARIITARRESKTIARRENVKLP